MINFRKLKQEFSTEELKAGKEFLAHKKVTEVELIAFDQTAIRVSAKVISGQCVTYQTQLEIDCNTSELLDSECDCVATRECRHLAALLFHLEQHLPSLLQKEKIGTQRQLTKEYSLAAEQLARSVLFSSRAQPRIEMAEIALIFSFRGKTKTHIPFQLAIRLPQRSKLFSNVAPMSFTSAMRYCEPFTIGGKSYYFSLQSFSKTQKPIATQLNGLHTLSTEKTSWLSYEQVGELLAAEQRNSGQLPTFYQEDLDHPIEISQKEARPCIELEYLAPPMSKLLLKTTLLLGNKTRILQDGILLAGTKTGFYIDRTYYPFAIERPYLLALEEIDYLTIPEPLFGTFIEYALPQLSRYAEVRPREVLEHLSTLPIRSPPKADCTLTYLHGQLEGELFFTYRDKRIPAAFSRFEESLVDAFVAPEGVFARDLAREQTLVEELFLGFNKTEQGKFYTKSRRKVIEFMTRTLPAYADRVDFDTPQNLLEQFATGKTHLQIKVELGERAGTCLVDLKIEGPLCGLPLARVAECIAAQRPFLELENKIVVFELEHIEKLVILCDQLGVKSLKNQQSLCPLWQLAHIDKVLLEGLSVDIHLSQEIETIRRQIRGEIPIPSSPIPTQIRATLRNYQEQGVAWLERLRLMHLSGILADDMGLGKSLQALVAIVQGGGRSLIVCPTSLLHNWEEEAIRFTPQLKVVVVEGLQSKRQKLIEGGGDLLITSYSLLQKDIEYYQPVHYAILDEGQHIKNRHTQNAHAVKRLRAKHRLILSGTPIENSLDELWSLFDFVMPGFLGRYEHFFARYARDKMLGELRHRVSPFILRRKKEEVLKELPPVSEVVHYCRLNQEQEKLYKTYVESARSELIELVKRDGFERMRMHIIATLTRLKQICCHPALFAKEKAEPGDSAKYDLLLELVPTLIAGGHKSIIFSQYTTMLRIMREDLEKMGVMLCYLDGATKERMELVRRFNEDPQISIFLVSLRAGGTGLNLTAADTVIHYDMWWNPATERQATDRIHRLGQKRAVSAYKLVTLGTIEEKIGEMQLRKRGLMEKVINQEEEVISRLSWEEVLELLQI